jgi:hypothetical protein
VNADIDGVTYRTCDECYRGASVKNGTLLGSADVRASGPGGYVSFGTVAAGGAQIIASDQPASCQVEIPSAPNQPPLIWKASGSAGSGSIRITSLTGTVVAGTFNCTAPAFSGGATGTKVVTYGSFNLRY